MLFLLKIIIAIVVLYVIIRKIGTNDILRILKGADLYLLSVAVLLMPLNIFLQYFRWRIFCVNTLKETSRKAAFFSVVEGISIGLFTPARIGEIFGRKLSLHNNSLTQVAVMTLVDKIFGMFSIALFGSMAMILYLNYQLNVAPLVTFSLLVLVGFVFLFFLFLLMNEEYWRTLILNFISRVKFLTKIKPKFEVLKQLDKRVLLRSIIFSLTHYICYLVQYTLLAAAFAGNYDFYILFWGGVLTFFTKTLIPSFSYGELGIREAISVFYLTGLGYAASVGFNASLSIFFINIIIPSAVGIIFLFLPDN
ncbi:MAG: flippase-like domain-containing protein [Ignavibacteriaceae bacterium]|nr:flippase-like domain-containing protein [Ignavibacteriaceae bacterium]